MRIGFAPLKRGLNRGKIRVYDSFSRPDNAGSLGNAETGQPWETISGSMQLKDNSAMPVSGAGYCVSIINANMTDCEITTVIKVPGNESRVIFRLVDANNFWQLQAKSTGYNLYKKISGSYTTVGESVCMPQSADIVEVTLRGNSIKIDVNSVQLFNITDSACNRGSKHGIGSHSASATAAINYFKVEAI